MNFYGYDDNFKFTKIVQGQLNPKKKSEFLQPAFTTTVAPPSEYSINEQPQYDEQSEQWLLVKSQYKKDIDTAALLEVNEYGVLLNEEIDGEVVARPQPDIDAENAVKIAEADEQTSIMALFELRNTMDSNIITKGKEVTLGTTIESMQVFTQAFNLRANNPAEYIADGLQVHYATTGYALGDALDTEVKITEYYTKILVELDKFRNAEIATYLAAKAALENA